MSSIRDKMIASIRGRSESPNPIYRGPRPESSSNASVASASSASIVSTSTSKGGPPPPPPPQAKQQLQQQQQQQQQQQSRPQARPKTPRNTTPSPMRRLPSSDALNRSSHNAIPTNDANDGSEQSKDRIIAQLKRSNTELTNKTAEMEVTFMNQCNVLAAEISDKNKLLQIQIDNNKELKLKVMSHESKLKEGIQIITALENEKQFQRSTITDLKNQLFQLQNDIEDSEYDKSNEVNLHKERTREAEQKTQQLEKEHSILLHKVDEVCMERDTVKAELVQTQMQLSLKEKEDQNNSIEIAIQGNNFVSGTPKFPNSPMNNSSYNTYNNNTNNNNANSSSSMNSNNSNYNNNGNNNISSSASVCSETTEVRQNWRQLEEKKEQLDKTLSLLHETQSALATLDHKHKALTKQFDDKLDNATTEIKTNLSKQIDELSSSLRARDDTIANLHERLETYNEDLTKAEDEVDRLNAEIDKARVSSLMEELEEAQKLLEQEKQLTAELTEKYDDLNDTVEQLEEETHQLRINSVDQIIEKKDKHITSLENEVTVFRNKLGEEKQQAEMLLNIKVSRINQLEDELKKVSTTPEMRLEQLEEENENLQHDLELMEKELNDAIEAHNQMENDMQRQLDQQNEDLLLSHSDETNDLVRKFDMSTNSIGLVNDMVVTRLKSNLTDMEEDHLIVMKELEEQIATKDDKIVELQDRIVKLQDEIGNQQKEASSIKSSHKDEISKLKTAIKETKNSVESIQTLVEEKEAEIKRLTNFANLEATAKEIQLAECTRLKKSEERNSTLLKEKEKEIKGLENDVAKLKANAERTQKDADGKNNQFLEDKENEIKRLKDDLTKQKASAEQIQKDLDEKHNQDLEEKENEIQSSRNDFAKYKASAEQKQLDMRQDVESREESWKVEKRQILEERKDYENKLNEALKESRDQFDYIEDLESREESWKAEKEQLIEEHEAFSLRLEKESSSQKENVQEMEELQKAWKGAKKQLMEEKEDYIKRLEDTLEESASLKEQIAELESKSLSQEEKLSSYKDDLLLLDELQNDFAQQQMELDTMKDLMSSEKKNHEKIIAGYKQTEGKKRGDKLKVIELSEEVDKLRLELRKLKGKENDISDKTRQEAVKRAYGVAKDTKHKKEISELEETWKREINELKRKLSDRDTAMAATLRSSVLQDQRISNLKENLRQLQDKYNIGSDTFSVSSGHGAFEELENLRESVHTHEENQKSLSQQIKLLKKQLADARIKMSKNRNGSNTRQLEEYKTKVRERDGAIQTLVKSSITQEQQIAALRDEITDLKDTKSRRPESKNAGAPSWSEIERLQQESEIFAGQIIEQDEELEDLRRALKESLEDAKQNESLHEMVDDLREQLEEQHNMRDKEKISKRTMSDAIKMELEEERWRRNEDDRKNKTLSDAMNMELDEERRIREKERERNRTTSDAMKMELEEERKKRERLENELENIQSKVGRSDKQDMRLTKIHDELEEVEEANQKLQYEMRDLRRKLRGARLEAERVNELESELSETRKTLSEMKKLKHQSGGSNEHHSREELDEIIEQRDALDSENQKMQKRLQNMEEECKKIEEAHHNLEEALGICREEKDKLYDEFAAKMLEMKKIEEALRQELTSAETNRNEIEVKTEQKIKKLEENESILKSQIESQKALREIAVNDKDISKTQALQEVAMYQARMIEFQKNNDDQNDLIASLTAEVKNLRNTQMQRADTESTEIIAALSDEVKKLRQENMSKKNDGESSEIIIALTEEVKKLRNAQSNNDSDDVIAALTQEVKTVRATLNKERQGQNSAGEIERVIRSEIDLEMQSIRNQKDFLGKENMKLQTKLDALGGSDSKKTAALKKQVEEAEKGRTLFEKTMISTYERKLNLMQMNKDLTIDGLRKDLTQSKETLKEVESDLLDNIKQLETEKNELEMELKAKMQHKNAKIQFLEQTLSAHEQVASHMKDELDQLQNGMETVSVTRRAELEEMQEELMNVQSRATRYEREITALKMKIEDQRAHHKNEMSRLQYHMEEMEMENDEAPSIRQLAEKDKMALHNMSKQVDSLRTKVSSLQEENFDLREKIEKKGDARSSKNDKWRNSALQEQVQALTRRLREVEDDDASIRSSSSRRSMRSGPGTQRRIPPTPRGTGLSNRRTGFGSVTDDISTHTEETF